MVITPHREPSVENKILKGATSKRLRSPGVNPALQVSWKQLNLTGQALVAKWAKSPIIAPGICPSVNTTIRP